jgi:RNA polymerase sigma-70 factor, ECF subfamily
MTGVPRDGAEALSGERPSLSVVSGLRYTARSQVFSRWVIPTYQTSFRWTGNRSDAEDATTWVFLNALSRLSLPDLVPVVEHDAAEAALDAVSRHWSERYGVASFRCSEIHACEGARSNRPAMTLGALFEDLPADARLVLVLRFLRRRTLPAIAAQFRVEAGVARAQMVAALGSVAERLGIKAGASPSTQAEQVAAFVDDLAARKKPLRFEVSPHAWAAMVAATHIQAAVAGNNLPRMRFVRSLEAGFEERLLETRVTRIRIWTA